MSRGCSAWVIVGSSGAYDAYSTWIVATYLVEGMAREDLAKLNKYADSVVRSRKWSLKKGARKPRLDPKIPTCIEELRYDLEEVPLRLRNT